MGHWLTRNAAFEELRRQKSKMFDAAVVEAAIAVLEEQPGLLDPGSVLTPQNYQRIDLRRRRRINQLRV